MADGIPPVTPAATDEIPAALCENDEISSILNAIKTYGAPVMLERRPPSVADATASEAEAIGPAAEDIMEPDMEPDIMPDSAAPVNCCSQ